MEIRCVLPAALGCTSHTQSGWNFSMPLTYAAQGNYAKKSSNNLKKNAAGYAV